VPSEVVESIVLPIHEHLNDPLGVGGGCGGNSLSVRLKTGSEQSCLTQEIASFSAGQIKSWSGQTLGSCKDFKLDNSTKVQVLTQSYYNGYCLVNGVEIKTKSLTYFCNIGDDWRYSTNNDDTFSCRHWWHNWYGTTEQQNSRTTVSTSHTPSPKYTYRSGEYCDSVYGLYSTLGQAKTACDADSDCMGICDWLCDGDEYVLCHQTGFFGTSSSGHCIYDKFGTL